MKVPPKRKGNEPWIGRDMIVPGTLNESPSEKEGKYGACVEPGSDKLFPSMKVPPKRKGNPKQGRGGNPTHGPQ